MSQAAVRIQTVHQVRLLLGYNPAAHVTSSSARSRSCLLIGPASTACLALGWPVLDACAAFAAPCQLWP